MYSSISIVLLPILAALSHSAATPLGTEDMSALDIIRFTTCKEPNLKGGCRTWDVITQSQCVGVAGTEWDDVISSVEIPDGYRCRLWGSNSCNSDLSTPDIYAPGANSLPKNMDNKATSFKCYVN